MKLHNLTIQAFGPFAGTEKVNFEDLGEHPLFLIDGPTGAGKSSILHAICYALYGETTDEDRKDLGVRCDNAEEQLLTSLSLDFSIKNQRYRITRIPTQARQKKSGDGFTEQKAEAHLAKLTLDEGCTPDYENWQEQTLVSKKKKQADDMIKTIVGLSAQQFRQVMVLPQGKFRELLLANSTDRQAILSTLFQTEIYQRIEQLLKTKAGNIEKEYGKFSEQIDIALTEVLVTNVEELDLQIDNANKTLTELQAQKELANSKQQAAQDALTKAEQITAMFTQQTQTSQSLTQHLLHKDDDIAAQKKLARSKLANAISGDYLQLSQLKQQIAKNSATIEQLLNLQQQQQNAANTAKDNFQKAASAHNGRDAILANINQLTSYVDIQKSFSTLEQKVAATQKLQQDSQKQITAYKEEHQNLAERSQNGLVYIEKLQQSFQGKSALINEQNICSRRLELLNNKLANKKNITLIEQNVAQLTVQEKQAKQNYQNATTHANTVEMHWHANQAAVLAATLTNGESCPVCGSLEHPQPAVIENSGQDISKQAVQQARAAESQCLKALTDIEKQVATQNEAKLQQQNLIAQIDGQLLELAAIIVNDQPLADSQYEQYLQNINEQLNTLVKQEQELPRYQNAQRELQAKLAPLNESIVALEAKLPELAAQVASADTEYQQAKLKLPEQYRAAQELQDELTKQQQFAEKLANDLAQATNLQTQANNALNTTSAQLTQLQQQNSGLQTDLQKVETNWHQQLKANAFADDNDYLNARLNDQQQQLLQQNIESYALNKNALESKLALLNEQLKQVDTPNIDALNESLESARASYQQVDLDWSNAGKRLAKLTDVDNKIKALKKEQEQHKKQFEVIGTLATAAAGKGSVKVSLERFVLGDLLDSVLAIASKRLHIMSKGQYQLVRQNEGDQKKNVSQGLDLAIDDAYTGKTRPVATLSGGESFLASLALALGLSDVVQQRSGGIVLDTLFIDEGFGSLDQDSLQLAIQTLIDLQRSGRTIGIISHVSELKEQMALRIDVQSSKQGSSIKLVADQL